MAKFIYCIETGKSNDGFLLENTFYTIKSRYIYLERLFKRSYKICIRSVILGELVLNESFRNYKRFSLIFPEHFRGNLMYYEYYYF